MHYSIFTGVVWSHTFLRTIMENAFRTILVLSVHPTIAHWATLKVLHIVSYGKGCVALEMVVWHC